jgi:arylsulfatase A-like enzyme
LFRVLGLAAALSCTASAAAKTPKLALVIVVDQLRADAFIRARKNFGKTGIERLIAEGAFLSDAHFSHANTDTGPGHAAIVSGTYAYKTGIIGRRFYDRVAGKVSTMLADPGHPVLEAHSTPDDDDSPANFVGETVGDHLRLATSMRGKVVAVAGRDTAAVLLGGRSGRAYWFSAETGKMTSSTFYSEELPSWVKEFNAKGTADTHFGKTWDRAIKESEYPGKDDVDTEADVFGLGRVFPHPVGGKLDKPGPEFYVALSTTPFANDLEVAFAKSAIEGEQLGKDADTDLLLVSFTANDRIGHAFGPESQEAFDALIRLDKQVADLVAACEKAAGKGNLVVVFTADHGCAPTPEAMAQLHFPAGRIAGANVRAAVSKVLSEKFGAGEWVVALEEPDLYLNARLIAERKLSAAAVEETAGEAALHVEGIADYFTHSQLEHGLIPMTPLGKAAQLSFFPERSGDVVLVPREFYIWASEGDGSHGSGHRSYYRYDTHVPLIFWGPGVKPGIDRQPVDMTDVAPTLSYLLGINAPAGSDGRIISEIVK